MNESNECVPSVETPAFIDNAIAFLHGLRLHQLQKVVIQKITTRDRGPSNLCTVRRYLQQSNFIFKPLQLLPQDSSVPR